MPPRSLRRAPAWRATQAYSAAAVLYNGLGRYEETVSAARQASSNTFEPWISMWALVELVGAVKYYIDTLASDRDALRGSFEFYRAWGTTTAQNEQRKARRLRLPVLAIGGSESGGEGVAATMKLVAADVQGVILAGSGHWVAEQAPEELLAALTKFLAPYRDAWAAAQR